jgi:hypothetical protein
VRKQDQPFAFVMGQCTISVRGLDVEVRRWRIELRKADLLSVVHDVKLLKLKGMKNCDENMRSGVPAVLPGIHRQPRFNQSPVHQALPLMIQVANSTGTAGGGWQDSYLPLLQVPCQRRIS